MERARRIAVPVTLLVRRELMFGRDGKHILPRMREAASCRTSGKVRSLVAAARLG
jgi:hypothetical protein